MKRVSEEEKERRINLCKMMLKDGYSSTDITRTTKLQASTISVIRDELGMKKSCYYSNKLIDFIESGAQTKTFFFEDNKDAKRCVCAFRSYISNHGLEYELYTEKICKCVRLRRY